MLRLDFIKRLNSVSLILLVLLAIQLGFFIWAINRGLDFTDETYGYMGFKHPEEVQTAATYYTVIFNAFFGWMGVSIVKVRIIRLLLLLFCGLAFALGLSKWFQRISYFDPTHQTNLVLFILLGSFLINAHGDQSFTYNISSNFLLQLIGGGFLFLFQREKRVTGFYLLLYCCLGALLFLLFAVKFSNAILLSLIILLMLFYDNRNLKIVTIYSLAMLLGAVTMGFLLFKGSFPGWLINYKNTLLLLNNSSSSSIWSRYIEDFHFTRTGKIGDHAIVVIVTIVLLLLNRQLRNEWMKAMLALIIAGMMIFVTYDSVYYLGGPKHYYVYTGLYILLAFILICVQILSVVINLIRKKNQAPMISFMALLLMAIPFCGALGTGNLLSIQIMWYMSFFFAALYILLYLNNAYILNMMVVVLGINAALQSVSGLIYYPYRIDQALYEESNRLPEKVSTEEILVNSKLKASVETAYDLIYSKTKFSKGDPIFASSPDYYGFIYLLDGVLPGWGWYDEKATNLNCISLRNTQARNLDRMIIFTPIYYEMDSIYLNCFSQMNINFPDNYVKVGEVPYFMGEIDRTFTIHVPKNILKE